MLTSSSARGMLIAIDTFINALAMASLSAKFPPTAVPLPGKFQVSSLKLVGRFVMSITKLTSAVLLILSLLLLTPTAASAFTRADKHKGRSTNHSLTRAEVKEAAARLSEMGYGMGRNALIAFQKYEGHKVTGRMSREDFDVMMNATAPLPRDAGYKHVEVDLDRQVLLLTDSEGAIKRILPVSTGSDKHYSQNGMSGRAYTPRGRFRVYAKMPGWKKSPLGLLYYPNYFSDGLAIHGNPSVPQSPESHGCIRIPMSAAVEISRLMPVGTIVLIYDKQSFVSAKDWADKNR